MPLGSPIDVLSLLASGSESELVGLEESRWFDAKSEPYRLEEDRQKWELAKDVTALANADGGLILIAARTEQPEAYLEERVTEVVPVPEARINVKQYLDVLVAWTFPPMGHNVRLHSFPRHGSKVLLAIEVPPTPDDEKPLMVRTIASIGGRDVEVWAIARRVGTGTEWIHPAQVWADIRDGRIARRSIGLSREPRGPSVEERALAAYNALSRVVAAEGKALLSYVAVPPDGRRFERFYSDDGIMGVLKTLPQRALRSSGFGLGYGVNIQTLDAALLDVEEGRRGLMVQPDGVIAAIAVADKEFLGWATEQGIPPPSLRDKPNIRLNHYVLAEYSLEFGRFVHEVGMERLGDDGWELAVMGRRLQTGDPAPYLPLSWQDWLRARAAQVDEGFDQFSAAHEAGSDAFRLLRSFVEWFGLSPEDVPFSTNERITAETVRAWG